MRCVNRGTAQGCNRFPFQSIIVIHWHVHIPDRDTIKNTVRRQPDHYLRIKDLPIVTYRRFLKPRPEVVVLESVYKRTIPNGSSLTALEHRSISTRAKGGMFVEGQSDAGEFRIAIGAIFSGDVSIALILPARGSGYLPTHRAETTWADLSPRHHAHPESAARVDHPIVQKAYAESQTLPVPDSPPSGRWLRTGASPSAPLTSGRAMDRQAFATPSPSAASSPTSDGRLTRDSSFPRAFEVRYRGFAGPNHQACQETQN